MSRKFRNEGSKTPCFCCDNYISCAYECDDGVCYGYECNGSKEFKGETTKQCKDFRVRYERIKKGSRSGSGTTKITNVPSPQPQK